MRIRILWWLLNQLLPEYNVGLVVTKPWLTGRVVISMDHTVRADVDMPLTTAAGFVGLKSAGDRQ